MSRIRHGLPSDQRQEIDYRAAPAHAGAGRSNHDALAHAARYRHSMSLFIIGDLQGCYGDVCGLVDQLPLREGDELWLCGDLINRGPDSLATLRWLRRYRGTLRCVLGNHDLAVLAQARGHVAKCGRTARELLAAADGPALLDWLQAQPLLVEAPGVLMVHAGLPPEWDLDDARREARRIEAALRSPADSAELLRQMYGNLPDRWSPELTGIDRLRYSINALTRMRLVAADGRLDFSTRVASADALPDQTWPWFAYPGRRSREINIVFGHWSTLGQVYWPEHRVWGLDTGCVWGGGLTALQWPERRLYFQPCPPHQQPG